MIDAIHEDISRMPTDGWILLVVFLVIGLAITVVANYYEDAGKSTIPDVDDIKQKAKKQEHIDEYL